MRFNEFVHDWAIEPEAAEGFCRHLQRKEMIGEQSGWRYNREWMEYFHALPVRRRRELLEYRAMQSVEKLQGWVKPPLGVLMRVHYGKGIFSVTKDGWAIQEVVIGCN